MRTVTVLLSVLSTAPLLAQVADPPYLREFPTVERVKQAMTVSDPREAALRQMGAFQQLQVIIKALSGPREFGTLTPGESKLIRDYSTAQFDIGQTIDKAFPGPYRKWQKVSQNTPYAYDRTDPRFGIEDIEVWKLLTPAIQDQFYREVGVVQNRIAARAKADTQNMLRAQAEQAEAQRELAGKGEEERQIRRCVESGRSQLQCTMEGLGKGFTNLLGGVVPGLKKEPIYGVRLGGVYPGANKLSLTFYTEAVTLGCQDLIPESHEYMVGMKANGLAMVIANSPKPIVFAVGSDGRLAGPGPVDIAGRVLVGYEQGTRTWSDGRTEPISRPVYSPATRRCTIGTLAAAGSSPALGSMSTAPAAGLNLLLGSPDKDAGKPTPAGLRMSGEYGSQAGLDVEFRPEGAVVGCREATALRPYAVQIQGTQVSVRVQHGTSPFTLALGADGRLTGTGSIRVDGRAVTGTDANGDLTYATRSASCSLGSIGPASGGSGAATASAAAPASTGSAVLALTIGIPVPAGAANPFRNSAFLLLDGSAETILTTAGLRAPAGASVLGALGPACQSQAAACQQGVVALQSHALGVARPDPAGKAQFPGIAPGTYYLFGAVPVNGKSVIWNLKVELRAGSNPVLLDERNGVPGG